MNYRPLLLIIAALFPIFLFSACSEDEPAADTIAMATATPQKPCREIPLMSQGAETFAYNPADNTLTMIIQSENSYTAYNLRKDDTWAKKSAPWKTGKNRFLDNFVYGPDGDFYACLGRYTKTGRTRQTLIRLKKNGKTRRIALRDLNQMPKTRLDTMLRERGGSVVQGVTDLRFSGTILSVTYANYGVKFYNIGEGEPLGAASITGQAGRNIFYDYGYLTQSLWNRQETFSLSLYDIRSGELRRTIPVENAVSAGAGQFFLSNYLEHFYLLTGDGLYVSSPQAESFRLEKPFDALGIPNENRILYFQAARGGILYLVHQDPSARLHLTRFSTFS